MYSMPTANFTCKMNFTGDEATSPHHQFLFKPITSAFTSVPLVISHVWHPNQKGFGNYALVHSATFDSKDLPDIKFEIFAAVTEAKKLTIHLTKTPADPATSTFKITFNGNIMKIREIDNWTNNRIIDEILIPSTYGQLYGVTVAFELAWHGFVKKPNASPPIDLHRHLKHLFETSDLTDFVIAVEDEEILTHKAILASQSPVFLGMFKSNMTESVNNRLEISHIESGIMKKVVEFLYTGEIDSKLDVNILLSILAVANEYQIIDLKNLCEHVLCTKITVNNALVILEGANLYGVPKLVKETITLMVYNKRAIVHLSDFKDLYRRKPDILLEFFIRVAEM